ncbi:hypothetical protein GY15_18580 [Delftia sp. 670]|nr:hypothetical protein GY15_18580 [Delftia sp. 670]
MLKTAWMSRTPASLKVGTSGRAMLRVSEETARALSLPDLMCCSITDTPSTAASIWPAMTSGISGAAPL